jgi:uncharacterized protein (TIGR04255 family)
MAPQYKRPPIVEAIIEFRFENPVSKELVDKLERRFLTHYPALPQQGVAWNFNVDTTSTAAKVEQQFQSYKLTSTDGTDLLVLGVTSFGVSRLAPYEGWAPFVTRTKRDWEIWRRMVGHQRVTRIGVRYINRIDIPAPNNEPVELPSFLTLFPVRPEFPGLGVPPMDAFSMSLVLPLDADCKLTLNVGNVASPLVKTQSVLLDIDVAREVDVPQREEDIWSFLERIRDLKDIVFETCVTDRSRELFSS